MYQGKDLNMSGIQNRAHAKRCTVFKTIGEEGAWKKRALAWEQDEDGIAGSENIWVWGAGRSL